MQPPASDPQSATDVQLSQPLCPTPADILDRYTRNPHWALYEKEWIFRNIPIQGKTWLDFGCGTGEITAQLALLGAARVISVDVTPGLLEMTRQQAELDRVSDRVRTVCGEITALEPEPVDVALSFAVLHHVPDHIEEVVGAIRRWIKPGGMFVFCEPVCYPPALDWLRYHSGVDYDALDPGERKLTGRDLAIIEKCFQSSRRVHFRILARLGRLLGGKDHSLRWMDAGIRRIPGSRFLAGTVLGVCRL